MTSPKSQNAPVFMVLALFGMMVCLFTPRIIVALPVLSTIVCAVISIFRRERARVVSGLVLVGAIGILILTGSTLSQFPGSDASALRAVEIVNSNWRPDPTFGRKGTIRWNVQIRNISDKYVANVRVELTTYDVSEQLVTTTFTFVSAIPPGETRSDESYADYYGTEKRAKIQVTSVLFGTR